MVNSRDDLMLIVDNGVLVRFGVHEVREMGRSTQGVRLINLDDGSLLTGFQSLSEPSLEKIPEVESGEKSAD